MKKRHRKRETVRDRKKKVRERKKENKRERKRKIQQMKSNDNEASLVKNESIYTEQNVVNT